MNINNLWKVLATSKNNYNLQIVLKKKKERPKKKNKIFISHKSHLKRQKVRNIGSTEGSIVKRNKTRVNEISLTPVQKRRVIHREHPSFPINVAFFPSPSDIIMAGHKGLGNGYRSTRKGTRRNETYEPVRVCVCSSGDNTFVYEAWCINRCPWDGRPPPSPPEPSPLFCNRRCLEARRS